MKHARHFENVNRTSAREAECIGTMIADLRRVVQVLDCDVQTEEERSRIFDRSKANYPMLARTLAARRDNIKATIAALEARLSSIGPATTAELTIAA
jgi:ABC-type transporter Mla subunit MlaD